MVPRLSSGRRHTAGAEALPYPYHGDWRGVGAIGGHPRNTGRGQALPRTNRLGTEGTENKVHAYWPNRTVKSALLELHRRVLSAWPLLNGPSYRNTLARTAPSGT